MTARRKHRTALMLAVAGMTLLAACGKKGPPRPPDGEESRYTYPKVYPAPRSVVPRATPVPAPVPESEEEETRYEFPYARTKTKTIQSE